MLKAVVVILCFLVTCSVEAQQATRCEFKRMEDGRHFEGWLQSKLAGVAGTSPTSIYRIPVVVHVLHSGDSPGEGLNFPKDRIVLQIETLNQDFRRTEGTAGFNNHPSGDDSRIEFVLAQIDPDGNPTDGIDRVNITKINLPPEPRDIIDFCAAYSNWDPERYLNIWSLGGDEPGFLLGHAQFPMSDLEGLPNTEHKNDGIWINAYALGHGEINNYPDYEGGRTLTHEIGHFLGLLHTWGSIDNSRRCDAYTDYCEDTPPTPVAASGCPASKPLACDGRPAMIENYMDGAYDRCMNIFTKDQIARMRAVLDNSPRRKSLVTSPVIDRSVVVPEAGYDTSVHVYPNPATDKLYVALDQSLVGVDIVVRIHLLSGRILFNSNCRPATTTIEIPIPPISENLIVLSIDGPRTSFKQLIHVF